MKTCLWSDYTCDPICTLENVVYSRELWYMLKTLRSLNEGEVTTFLTFPCFRNWIPNSGKDNKNGCKRNINMGVAKVEAKFKFSIWIMQKSCYLDPQFPNSFRGAGTPLSVCKGGGGRWESRIWCSQGQRDFLKNHFCQLQPSERVGMQEALWIPPQNNKNSNWNSFSVSQLKTWSGSRLLFSVILRLGEPCGGVGEAPHTFQSLTMVSQKKLLYPWLEGNPGNCMALPLQTLRWIH